jgi:hypothetical protein
MWQRIIVSFCLVHLFLISSGQDFFELNYTNIEKKQLKYYMNAYIYAQAWLSTGKFIQNCNNCTSLSKKSLLKPSMLDSVSRVFNLLFPTQLYKTKYIPSDYYYVDQQKESEFPYIRKTLYVIRQSEFDVIYQYVITFDKHQTGETPEIYNLQVFNNKSAFRMDNALLTNLYHRKLTKDRNQSAAPPIKE